MPSLSELLTGPLQTALVGLLTFVLGVALGHWLNLGRDRRKERIELADVVRERVMNARSGSVFFISDFQRDTLLAYYPWPARSRLQKALNAIAALQPTSPFHAEANRVYPERDPDAKLLDAAINQAVRLLRRN